MRAVVHAGGRLVVGGQAFRVALGRGGVRADKQEGDGATPAGPVAVAARAVSRRPGSAAGLRGAAGADRAG